MFRAVHVYDRKPKLLYAFTGYKVWLDSIIVNEKKLVADGTNNSIVVHDFSGIEGFLYEEGEDMDD